MTTPFQIIVLSRGKITFSMKVASHIQAKFWLLETFPECECLRMTDDYASVVYKSGDLPVNIIIGVVRN